MPPAPPEVRAREPVSLCLVRHLVVPYIYWEKVWPSDGKKVDLIAIDRAGAGDLHVVEIKTDAGEALDGIPELLAIPAHYRWVAYFAETLSPQINLRLVSKADLFPASGPGRVGLIEIVRMSEDDLGANIKIKAERFAGGFSRQIERFVSDNDPDMSFR